MDTLSNPMAPLEPLLSTRELAEYLGVPVKTIYEWRTCGHGPCAVRVGRHLKFAVSDVRAWVAQQHAGSLRCIAGLEQSSAEEAMRVLIVHTVGIAAFAAQPEGAGSGPIAATELRHNFTHGLD